MIWTVNGYQRIQKMMRVEADTEQEAIELAKAGLYEDVDTEPDRDVYSPAWTARKGWLSES